jgi:hypothetical protein
MLSPLLLLVLLFLVLLCEVAAPAVGLGCCFYC